MLCSNLKVTILVFLAALVQRKRGTYEGDCRIYVTILVFLAALVQRESLIANDVWFESELQSLFFWQL